MGTDGLHFILSHPLMNQPPYSIPSHASTTSLSLVDPFICYSAMFVCFHLEEKKEWPGQDLDKIIGAALSLPPTSTIADNKHTKPHSSPSHLSSHARV
jgi:hypothetical protein